MQKEDSGLFPTQLKSGNVSGEQIDQEQGADDVSPWKPWNSEAGPR